MILTEIQEQLERMLTAGVATSEGRWSRDFLYAEIHKARAVILRNDYIKNKRWSPQALQIYYPDYDVNYQDSVCYTRFQLPTGFIQADARHDGLVYFGSSSNKIFSTRAFRRIKSRVELSDFLNNEITSPANGRYVGVLLEGDIATIISKDIIKYPAISGVWDDPTKIPTYSILNDPYPVSGDMISLINTYAYQAGLGQMGNRNIDAVANTEEEGAAEMMQNNLIGRRK